MMNQTAITRRSKLIAYVTYSPETVAFTDVKHIKSQTPKQILAEYEGYRRSNANASVFVHVFLPNGKQLTSYDVLELARGNTDKITC